MGPGAADGAMADGVFKRKARTAGGKEQRSELSAAGRTGDGGRSF